LVRERRGSDRPYTTVRRKGKRKEGNDRKTARYKDGKKQRERERKEIPGNILVLVVTSTDGYKQDKSHV